MADEEEPHCFVRKKKIFKALHCLARTRAWWCGARQPWPALLLRGELGVEEEKLPVFADTENFGFVLRTKWGAAWSVGPLPRTQCWDSKKQASTHSRSTKEKKKKKKKGKKGKKAESHDLSDAHPSAAIMNLFRNELAPEQHTTHSELLILSGHGVS
jgi:hypothetical protein